MVWWTREDLRLSGTGPGDDQKPAGSGVWRTPDHLLEEERLPPGSTEAAGSGTFGESDAATSGSSYPQASISDTWRRPAELERPPSGNRPEHRITIDDIRTLISASLAPGRRLSFAAASSAFRLASNQSTSETAIRSFGRALESELSSSASLAGHAARVDLRAGPQAVELELPPGPYLFLSVAIVQATASDSGTFIRMIDKKGDHSVLQQFIRSLGGNLRLDRQGHRDMSLSLYLPLAG